MDSMLVPSDVEQALVRAGLRAVAPAGGTGWVAEAVDGTAELLELHVVAAVGDDQLAQRAARLRELRHEHLARVRDVVELSPGRLALLVEHVPGLTLAQIRSARAPLTDGEAATVTIPVAGALAALHDADLAHGAVSDATVVVRPDGRPVLTDLRGALLGADDPEADARRLVATVLAQMPGADVHLVAGVEGELWDALTGTLTTPGLTAERLVDECYAATDPAPIRQPDAGVLASSALAAVARAGEPGQWHSGTRREERVRRRRRGLRLSAVLLSGVVVLAGAGVVVSRLLTSDPPAVTTALMDTDDPVAAAVELSRLRVQVVGAGDPAGLGAVEVVGGPAYTADARLPGLDGSRVDGLAVDVQDAWLVPEDGSRANTTDVAVTAAMSAHSRHPADEGAAVEVAASAPRTVVLGLRWTAQGWRVWDVLEP